jgi:hypothetical protein
MLIAIDNLREIVRRCRTGEPLSGDLAAWLARSLDEFLTHRRHSLDEALGLKGAKGGVPWWLEEAIRRRDQALRRLAQCHFPALSVSGQAARIRTSALRYAASAWRFDRERGSMPESYAGTDKEWLWSAFKSGAPMPICERQLRHVLGR